MTVAYERNVKLSGKSRKMLVQLSVKTILFRRALTKDRDIFIATIMQNWIKKYNSFLTFCPQILQFSWPGIISNVIK